ncbi:MAG: hypothetical protein ABWY31_03575 [Pseudoxanthomonas sp.]
MKRIPNIFLLLIAWAAVVSLASCARTKTEKVSAAAIAALPAGKSFDVDLTRAGTLYQFETAGTDLSRVSVRTAAGTRTLGELLKATNAEVGSGLLLGRPEDFRENLPPSIKPPAAGTVAQYDCGAVACKCDSTLDCIDLILDGKCAGDFTCSTQTSNCYCTPRP